MASLFCLSLLSSAIYADNHQVIVGVDGMVCAFCAQGLNKKFTGHSSVKSLDVDLEKKILKVTLKDGATMNEEEARNLVKDAGYKFRSFEQGK
jgi:mercuric ion binding protein